MSYENEFFSAIRCDRKIKYTTCSFQYSQKLQKISLSKNNLQELPSLEAAADTLGELRMTHNQLSDIPTR